MCIKYLFVPISCLDVIGPRRWAWCYLGSSQNLQIKQQIRGCTFVCSTLFSKSALVSKPKGDTHGEILSHYGTLLII